MRASTGAATLRHSELRAPERGGRDRFAAHASQEPRLGFGDWITRKYASAVGRSDTRAKPVAGRGPQR